MRGQLMDEFQRQDVIASGDGKCDSQGFNAENLCYFIIEGRTSDMWTSDMLA